MTVAQGQGLKDRAGVVNPIVAVVPPPPTVKEQLEALGVADSLIRVENPLVGEWEAAGGVNLGQCTATGWTMTAEKTLAAAKRKAAINLANGGIAKFTVPVIPDTVLQGLELQFGVTGDPQKAGFFLERTAGATCRAGLFTDAGSAGSLAGVAFVNGDIFGLSWERVSGKLTVWRNYVEVFSAIVAVPASVLKPAIFFAPEGVAGVAGRVSNFAAGVLL